MSTILQNRPQVNGNGVDQEPQVDPSHDEAVSTSTDSLETGDLVNSPIQSVAVHQSPVPPQGKPECITISDGDSDDELLIAPYNGTPSTPTTKVNMSVTAPTPNGTRQAPPFREPSPTPTESNSSFGSIVWPTDSPSTTATSGKKRRAEDEISSMAGKSAKIMPAPTLANGSAKKPYGFYLDTGPHKYAHNRALEETRKASFRLPTPTPSPSPPLSHAARKHFRAGSARPMVFVPTKLKRQDTVPTLPPRREPPTPPPLRCGTLRGVPLSIYLVPIVQTALQPRQSALHSQTLSRNHTPVPQSITMSSMLAGSSMSPVKSDLDIPTAAYSPNSIVFDLPSRSEDALAESAPIGIDHREPSGGIPTNPDKYFVPLSDPTQPAVQGPEVRLASENPGSSMSSLPFSVFAFGGAQPSNLRPAQDRSAAQMVTRISLSEYWRQLYLDPVDASHLDPDDIDPDTPSGYSHSAHPRLSEVCMRDPHRQFMSLASSGGSVDGGREREAIRIVPWRNVALNMEASNGFQPLSLKSTYSGSNVKDTSSPYESNKLNKGRQRAVRTTLPSVLVRKLPNKIPSEDDDRISTNNPSVGFRVLEKWVNEQGLKNLRIDA